MTLPLDEMLRDSDQDAVNELDAREYEFSDVTDTVPV